MNSEFEFNYPRQTWADSDGGEESLEFDERFELLSAYIDGEVTPQEKTQVQAWIDNDPEFKQVYLGLIRLQVALPQMPVPPSISAEQLSQQVFDRLDCETRWRRLWFWGSVTAAAVVVAACSSILVKPMDPSLQQANLDPHLAVMEADPLMIAINEPMFEVLTKPDPGNASAGERAEPRVR